jgi:predicted transglutaminase-like cysteine proteinase
MDGIFRRHGIMRAMAIALVLACASTASADAKSSAKAKPRKTDETSVSLRSPILDMRLPVDVPDRQAATRFLPTEIPAGARFFTINQVLAKHAGAPAQPRLAAASIGNFANDGVVTAPALPPISDEPFGLFAFRAPDGALWTKWRALSARLSSEAATLARCRTDDTTCPREALRFLALVSAARTHDGRARITVVNRIVNASVRYVSDFAQHGVADRWSAPLETFASRAGDCEDYAIAKFVALREAGQASADLRLLLVRDLISRQDHAILAARHDGRWLILDNRWDGLAEASESARFMPLFALDGDGVKLFAAPYAMRPLHESETDVTPAGDGVTIGGGGLPLLM